MREKYTIPLAREAVQAPPPPAPEAEEVEEDTATATATQSESLAVAESPVKSFYDMFAASQDAPKKGKKLSTVDNRDKEKGNKEKATEAPKASGRRKRD